MVSRALVAVLIVSALAQDRSPSPRADPGIDLQQLAGTYFEIARIPNHLQNACTGDVSTIYAARADGHLDVLNRCRKVDGSISQVHGVGRKTGDGKVQARFTVPWRPFARRPWEDYWILAAGPEYGYLVIGNESRTCLWILSRLPRLPQLAFRHAREIAEANGYDVDELVETPQSE